MDWRLSAYHGCMISMQGVPSSLIARHESWVRKQASALSRRLPANVEKADLIQAGLIGVAQAAMNFQWEGDPDSEEGREAFLRYAQLRVKGAMLDELRQMDQLSRSQRRKFKVIQIARERWMQGHDMPPNLSELSEVCGIEVAELEQAASTAQTQSLSDEDDDGDHYSPQGHAATPNDEVEARVDTAILLRRLEKFFATLPERERQVIDAYMGIGMSTEEVAESLGVSTSRVSQIYQATVKRITLHFAHKDQRALDRFPARSGPAFDQLVATREAQAPWGTLLEQALTAPAGRFGDRGRRKPAAASSGIEGGETA
jgi:RNA polymerase sigma factor for flagellar operon FliA